MTALLAFVLALAGAPLPSFVTPVSAQGTFTYEQLKSFGSPSIGARPRAGLIQGTDGAFYGTAYSGTFGSSGYAGTVFKLNPDGSEFTALMNFNLPTTGANPRAGLIQGTDGALYGTTDNGGSSGDGMVFKLNPDGSGFTVLHNGDNGGFYGGLIQGVDGALYGTTPYSNDSNVYGSVFKLNLDGSAFTILKEFDYDTTGGYLYAELLQGADGSLYGTTYSGGSGDSGTVFKVDPDNFTVLKHFDDDTTGSHLETGLIQGTDGALYGTARLGGTNGSGTAFKLNPDGSGFTVLVNFASFTTGAHPYGKLMQGIDGAIYGTARDGGTGGSGTVFRLNPDGSSFTVLLHFDPLTTGAKPYAGLVQGTDGNLYGTTSGGGEAGVGTVFRLLFDAPGPDISALTPESRASGSGAFALTVEGNSFTEGATVRWNGADLDTAFISSSMLLAAVPSTPTTSDIYTALITVTNLDGTVSSPAVFVVLAANVAEVESSVAEAGETVTVSTAPTASNGTATGITATLLNSGDATPVTVSAATYSSNPSPSTALDVAGSYLDLQVIGADPADALTAHFYYPSDIIGAAETTLTLKFYNGFAWENVVSSGGAAPVKDSTDNLDGTVSGGRLEVYFDITSTPKITELGGTYFAVTFPRPPLAFDGFRPPIGGADATGGSFANPVRTFKGGSTIPVKFTASRDGAAIVTGVHTLQATKYSSETTAETPVDATPQGAATTGNRFELHGGQWHFNLDTKATGITKGIWQLVATLSDGSTHQIWIQIK